MSALANTASENLLLKKANFANLNAVQQAQQIHQLFLDGLNQQEIAALVGVSGPQVSNLMLIYSMPKVLKELIEDDKASATLVLYARRVYKGKSDEEIAELLQNICAKKKGRAD